MRKNKQQSKKNTKSILDNLPNSFDCSGSFQLQESFILNLMTLKEHFILKFPNPLEQDIKRATQNGKKSGFGKGTQNLIDQSYRMAFQYLPNQLGLPSNLMQKLLNQTTQAVKHSLGIDCNVRAQLIKLNIYPIGGLFKKHVDSPKKQAFGSLVAFLPCYFKGGDLIVEKKSISHNFSFGGDKQNNKINWVAFYNDCVHQITEVLDGWRLTLSFNLFYETPLQTQIFPKQEMINLLMTNLQAGSTYGYYCDHYYGNNSLQNARKQMKNSRFLKGNDYNLYVAAKALGAKKILLKILLKQNIINKKQFQQYKPQNEKQFPESQPQNDKVHQIQLQQKGTKCKSKQNSIKPQPRFEKINFEQQQDQNELQQAQQIILLGEPQTINKIGGWVNYEDDYGQSQIMYLKQLKTKRWEKQDYNKVVWLNQQVQSSNYMYAICGYYGNDYSIGEKYCRLVILIYM